MFLAFIGATTMSSLQKFLPASEPARSEALAQLKKTHHVPRHLVRGVARGAFGKQASAVQQDQQQEIVPQGESPSDPPVQVG